MRAAVVRERGATPVLEQFADPRPGPGVPIATLLAAALNPLDLAFVNDQFPLRPLRAPCVAGYEGVVQLDDGTRRYVTAPPAPYGTLAESVPVPEADGFPVPAGLDPALAAALGIAGLAGWIALDQRAQLQSGETVLVLGAGGSAGRLAVRSARVLGAGRVVGAARGKNLPQTLGLDADAVVDLADEGAVDAELAAAAPGGYDVIVDFLWGGFAPLAMNHARSGARYVQVGNSAGAASTIVGPVLRNKPLTLIGHGLFVTPVEVRRSAYARLAGHAAEGEITMDLERTRLADIGETWEHLRAGASRKLVVTP
ncbi:zinc-binding dehydrogenase [Streptomyces sp. NBC_01288]|uniref:quinone oxidoreductase family protein n=1 Tax=Streptomyces sp. NBC_01288 TaxID=2903814 RepID=UPI002E0EB38C|nr:zinc-binding dehydrogenase [Streptomyces sp. NBC_01288]